MRVIVRLDNVVVPVKFFQIDSLFNHLGILFEVHIVFLGTPPNITQTVKGELLKMRDGNIP